MPANVLTPVLPIVLAWGGAAAASPVDGVPRVLIDDRLQERAVALVGLQGGQVRYVDAGGLARDEPASRYVAIVLPRGEPQPGAPTPAVWFTDGQRLAGIPRPGDPPADHLLWKHPVFGPMTLPLDHVSRVVLRRPSRPASAPPRGPEDSILLVNGDRLAGFLASFGLTLRVEVGDETRDLSSRRVAEADLANPPEPMRGTVAWLADGSILRVDSFQTSRTGEVTIKPAVLASDAGAGPGTLAAGDGSDQGAFPLADIVAVVFDASRLVPLASLAPASQAPVGDRRWTEPITVAPADAAPLAAADIALPGPMTVEWALPAGARRFAGELELTPDLWTWGDCEVVVSVVSSGGRAAELARERLNAARPRVGVNVAIDAAGSRLRVRVEPGRYGSIQDRVVLRRPMILFDAPPK